MNNLPDILHIKNKDNFPNLKNERVKRLLNEDVFLFLIERESENDYYDLDKFCIQYLDRNMKKMQELMSDILTQLEKLGWKCKYSYNETGLFIYSTNNPPVSCW